MRRMYAGKNAINDGYKTEKGRIYIVRSGVWRNWAIVHTFQDKEINEKLVQQVLELTLHDPSIKDKPTYYKENIDSWYIEDNNAIQLAGFETKKKAWKICKKLKEELKETCIA